MKKLFPWLLAALMVAVVACDDSSTTSERTETYTDRAWTTEVATPTASGTWNLAGSPYYVPDSLVVPAGQTLTIEAGVDVYFGPTAGLLVEGNLQALGVLGSPVRFLGVANAEDLGLWQSIVFREGSDASKMSYCVVAFGSKFNNTNPEKIAAIVIRDSSPLIEHCLVWYNQYNGISLQRGALPRLRSNIVYENDGSGIVFDTSHVCAREVDPLVVDWVNDSLIVHNNVSANSSLQLRFPPSLASSQWGGRPDSLLFQFGNDVLYVDEDGEDVNRRNENNDKVDIYGNSVEDAMFDVIGADFQTFNSCSPCIESAFDYDGDQRADVGPTVYNESPGEIRKRLKTTTLSGQVYTVTCDAFSREAVTMDDAEIQFNGYFGLNLSGSVAATNTTFTATADRRQPSNWKSVVIEDNALGTIRFEGCTFAYGSESSYSGQNFITGGGVLELRKGAVVEVEDCEFHDTGSHAVSAHGAGSLVHVTNSRFDRIGLSAVYFFDDARGEVADNRIDACGSYGIYLLESQYESRIEGNLIANSLYGVKLQEAANVEILRNTIAGNRYGGIKLEEQCDPAIRYNLIVDNDYAGSEVATGIVGNQLGASLDTNNPMVNVNWFSGNGGSDSLAMPANWSVGDCNAFTPVSLTGDYAFGQSLPDCDNGGTPMPVGWSQGVTENPGPMLASLGMPHVLEDEVLVIHLGAISFIGVQDFVYTAAIDSLDAIPMTLEGNRLTFAPVRNWNGSSPLTVTATNSEGTVSETTLFTVVPVNDAPIVVQVEDQFLAVNETLTLPIESYDVEGDGFEVTIEVSISDGENEEPTFSYSDNSGVLTLTPAEDWAGSLAVFVIAEEDGLGEGEALTTRMIFSVTVN